MVLCGGHLFVWRTSLMMNVTTASSKLSTAILLSITTAMFQGRKLGMGEDLSDIIRTLFQNNPE